MLRHNHPIPLTHRRCEIVVVVVVVVGGGGGGGGGGVYTLQKICFGIFVTVEKEEQFVVFLKNNFD